MNPASSGAAGVTIVAEPSAWLDRATSLLTQLGEDVTLIEPSAAPADLARAVHATLALLVHADGAHDPLVTIARAWDARPDLPVVLSGSHIDDDTRAAALEAGVLFVLDAQPTGAQLEAALELARGPSAASAADTVRAMCRTMCSISSRIASATDDSFLQDTAREIGELFHAPIVSIFLYEGDAVDAPLRVVAHTGLPEHVRYGRSGGLMERVLRTQTGRITLRSAPESRSPTHRDQISASMCIPIVTRAGDERPRGVINVARTRARSVFTERDLQVANAIAALVAEALVVAESRQLATALDRRIRFAERMSTIGELAGGIAHEVANPISSVRANIDTIISYLDELKPGLERVRAQHSEVGPVLDDLPAVFSDTYEGLARTEAVVKQMKALMRLSSTGGGDEAVDVDALVEAALRLMRSRLDGCVEAQVEPGLAVRGRHVELCQALVNLLANAADACEQRARIEPGHVPQIRLVARADGRGGCALHVEDNGVGITAADLPRVFMPLFTTKPERGAGLGLSIVRRVADDHHGTVRARATPGSGASFTLTVPLASAASVLHPPRSYAENPVAA